MVFLFLCGWLVVSLVLALIVGRAMRRATMQLEASTQADEVETPRAPKLVWLSHIVDQSYLSHK